VQVIYGEEVAIAFSATKNHFMILHDELELQQFHLHWVLHALSLGQKSERVTYSRILLDVLEAQRTGFERMITGDELCFFLSYPYNSALATSRDEPPERVSPSTASTVCLTFRMGAHIIQHSSVIKLFQIWFRELHLMVIETRCKD
jgi:hypothetical protein